VSQFCTFTVI
jgi:hypothetical protein